MMDAQQVQLEASEVLLDIGVSFPVTALRVPFRREPLALRATMRRPTLGARIRIAREYLRMGVTAAEMETYTKEQQLAFVAGHGAAMSRIVAYGLVRSKWWLWLIPPVAWLLRWWVDERMLALAFMQFIRCMGTEDFMNIINCIEKSNPMQLSRIAKGS